MADLHLQKQIEDEAVLAKMGYKQVLTRTWGTFTAATIAISAMSVLTSITGEQGALLLMLITMQLLCCCCCCCTCC